MTVGNGRNSMDTLDEVAGMYGTGMVNDADRLITGHTSTFTEPPDSIKAYHGELVQQQAQISDQIRQVQATGVQLIGQLNQVAGAIAAVEKIMADQAK